MEGRKENRHPGGSRRLPQEINEFGNTGIQRMRRRGKNMIYIGKLSVKTKESGPAAGVNAGRNPVMEKRAQ